jgi:flavin-dependent dehydrogenase
MCRKSYNYDGDTAGLIHPVGNGMAMAIHSAKLAADTIHFLENRIDRATLENNYLNDWNRKKKIASRSSIRKTITT